MSHSKEREEKTCLNCGAQVTGRYCQVCGQENTEPRETVWTLVSHFFNDITHFDGKFFSTVKYLIRKPGFLSTEYIRGRRARYLHPIRMYVFTSAFFFIIFFSLFNPGSLMGPKNNEEQLKEMTVADSTIREKMPEAKDTVLKAAMQRALVDIDNEAALLKRKIAAETMVDSVKLQQRKRSLETAGVKIGNNLRAQKKIVQADSIAGMKIEETDDPQNYNFTSLKFGYNSQAAYDAIQKQLPADKRDGWFGRAMAHKYVLYNTKYKDDRKEALATLMETYMHSLPQALFVSLPVFALILLMLYARRKFSYVDHGIFSIHLYCGVFIFLIVFLIIDKIRIVYGWQWLASLKDIVVLGILFYLYKAMHNFYKQGWAKTLLKFLVLNMFSLIVVAALGIGFFILSLIKFS